MFFTSCPRANRNEESVIPRLHIGRSYIIHSFLSKGEDPPMCFACDEHMNYGTHFTYLFRFYWNIKREPFYSSVTACIISRNIIGKYFEPSERNQYFWQNINFQIILRFLVVFTHFLSLFLKIWMYTSFSRYIFLATVWWQNMYRPDITVLADGVKHQVTRLLTLETSTKQTEVILVYNLPDVYKISYLG